jgi:hypothetical protein
MTTVLECENCGHKLPSKKVELTNADITDEYEYLTFIGIVQNAMQKEGLTMFINNPSLKRSTSKSNNKRNEL